MAKRYPQFCALARAAELIGERWTLLIVRELLLGPKRFTDLEDGLHGIGPSVLAARLASLETAGMLRRSLLPPPAGVSVYELTEDGEALRPSVLELIRWGGRFLFPPRKGERFEPAWALLALQASARRTPSPKRSFVLRVRRGAKEASVHVAGGPGGTKVRPGEGPADATITAPLDTLLRLMSGQLSPQAAVRDGLAQVEGDARALPDFPLLFDIPAATPADQAR